MPAINKGSYNVPSGQELHDFVETAKLLSTCQYYQKMGPGGVLAIFLTAKEMGLPTMCCLNGGMYTFSGSVTLSAQMMNMMIVNAGHSINIIECSEEASEIEFVRSDRPEGSNTFRYRYTLDMAHKANYLTKNNWKTHPRDMLFNRCLSGGARKYMPDAIMNAYVHGELGKEDADIMPDENTIPITPQNQLSLEDQSKEKELLNAFKLKYGIGTGNDYDKYIKVIAEKCKKTDEDIVLTASKNDEGFSEQFNKWIMTKERLQESTA